MSDSKMAAYAPAPLRAGSDAQLIAAVRAQGSLYDVKHPWYMDFDHKVDAWRKVGEQLQADPTACKTRWNNIRDNYRKSLRRRPGERTRITKYKYAGQMAFMTKFLRAHLESEEDEDGKDDDDTATNTAPVQVPIECPAVKVENTDEQDETMVDYEFFDDKEPASSFPIYPASMHAVDAFLAGISPTLKAMTPRHLSLAKAEIYATVHKYEMKGIVEGGGGGWTKNVNPLP